MIVKYFYAALLCLLTSSVALPQDCPPWGDNRGTIKFLQDNKPNGTAIDPACVDRSFSTLAKDKSNAEVLIGLLDFERSIKKDHSLKGVSSKYPAVAALMSIGKSAMPHLIKAIKENESDLIRTNAANALDGIYRSCEKELIDKLESEATQLGIVPEQQERLRAAERYVQDRHAVTPCKSPDSASQ